MPAKRAATPEEIAQTIVFLAWAAEAVVDLFFWHDRRSGLFVGPAYGVAFADGRKSVSITVEILLTVP
jgi:hypothetical protein